MILGDPATLRTEALIRAYARFVDGLGGRYVTAEDVGTTQADMDLIRTVTPHVTGVSERARRLGRPVAGHRARACCAAMRAVAERLWGDAVARGSPRRASAGSGRSGRALADHLHADGRPADRGRRPTRPRSTRWPAAPASPWSCRPRRPRRRRATSSRPARSARSLSASAPSRSCAAPRWADRPTTSWPRRRMRQRIADAGVLYAPDYVVNAGGVINIAEETAVATTGRGPMSASRGIPTPSAACSTSPTPTGTTTAAAADRLAERRIDGA